MDYKGIKGLLDSSYQRGHFYLTCQVINCLIFSSSWYYFLPQTFIGVIMSVEMVIFTCCLSLIGIRGRPGRDRMVVRFTTTYAISAYHH